MRLLWNRNAPNCSERRSERRRRDVGTYNKRRKDHYPGEHCSLLLLLQFQQGPEAAQDLAAIHLLQRPEYFGGYSCTDYQGCVALNRERIRRIG